MVSKPGANEFLKINPNANYNARQLGEIFEKVIYEYSEAKEKTATIGGPASIVMIGVNNIIEFLKNDFSKNAHNSFTEFVDAIKRG
jgi:hypothetical protein